MTLQEVWFLSDNKDARDYLEEVLLKVNTVASEVGNDDNKLSLAGVNFFKLSWVPNLSQMSYNELCANFKFNWLSLRWILKFKF